MSETFDKFVVDHQRHPEAPVRGALRVYGVKDKRARPAGWLMPPLQGGEPTCDTSTSPTTG